MLGLQCILAANTASVVAAACLPIAPSAILTRRMDSGVFGNAHSGVSFFLQRLIASQNPSPAPRGGSISLYICGDAVSASAHTEVPMSPINPMSRHVRGGSESSAGSGLSVRTGLSPTRGSGASPMLGGRPLPSSPLARQVKMADSGPGRSIIVPGIQNWFFGTPQASAANVLASPMMQVTERTDSDGITSRIPTARGAVEMTPSMEPSAPDATAVLDSKTTDPGTGNKSSRRGGGTGRGYRGRRRSNPGLEDHPSMQSMISQRSMQSLGPDEAMNSLKALSSLKVRVLAVLQRRQQAADDALATGDIASATHESGGVLRSVADIERAASGRSERCPVCRELSLVANWERGSPELSRIAMVGMCSHSWRLVQPGMGADMEVPMSARSLFAAGGHPSGRATSGRGMDSQRVGDEVAVSTAFLSTARELFICAATPGVDASNLVVQSIARRYRSLKHTMSLTRAGVAIARARRAAGSGDSSIPQASSSAGEDGARETLVRRTLNDLMAHTGAWYDTVSSSMLHASQLIATPFAVSDDAAHPRMEQAANPLQVATGSICLPLRDRSRVGMLTSLIPWARRVACSAFVNNARTSTSHSDQQYAGLPGDLHSAGSLAVWMSLLQQLAEGVSHAMGWVFVGYSEEEAITSEGEGSTAYISLCVLPGGTPVSCVGQPVQHYHTLRWQFSPDHQAGDPAADVKETGDVIGGVVFLDDPKLQELESASPRPQSSLGPSSVTAAALRVVYSMSVQLLAEAALFWYAETSDAASSKAGGVQASNNGHSTAAAAAAAKAAEGADGVAGGMNETDTQSLLVGSGQGTRHENLVAVPEAGESFSSRGSSIFGSNQSLAGLIGAETPHASKPAADKEDFTGKIKPRVHKPAADGLRVKVQSTQSEAKTTGDGADTLDQPEGVAPATLVQLLSVRVEDGWEFVRELSGALLRGLNGHAAPAITCTTQATIGSSLAREKIACLSTITALTALAHASTGNVSSSTSPTAAEADPESSSPADEGQDLLSQPLRSARGMLQWLVLRCAVAGGGMDVRPLATATCWAAAGATISEMCDEIDNKLEREAAHATSAKHAPSAAEHMRGTPSPSRRQRLRAVEREAVFDWTSQLRLTALSCDLPVQVLGLHGPDAEAGREDGRARDKTWVSNRQFAARRNRIADHTVGLCASVLLPPEVRIAGHHESSPLASAHHGPSAKSPQQASPTGSPITAGHHRAANNLSDLTQGSPTAGPAHRLGGSMAGGRTPLGGVRRHTSHSLSPMRTIMRSLSGRSLGRKPSSSTLHRLPTRSPTPPGSERDSTHDSSTHDMRRTASTPHPPSGRSFRRTPSAAALLSPRMPAEVAPPIEHALWRSKLMAGTMAARLVVRCWQPWTSLCAAMSVGTGYIGAHAFMGQLLAKAGLDGIEEAEVGGDDADIVSNHVTELYMSMAMASRVAARDVRRDMFDVDDSYHAMLKLVSEARSQGDVPTSLLVHGMSGAATVNDKLSIFTQATPPRSSAQRQHAQSLSPLKTSVPIHGSEAMRSPLRGSPDATGSVGTYHSGDEQLSPMHFVPRPRQPLGMDAFDLPPRFEGPSGRYTAHGEGGSCRGEGEGGTDDELWGDGLFCEPDIPVSVMAPHLPMNLDLFVAAGPNRLQMDVKATRTWPQRPVVPCVMKLTPNRRGKHLQRIVRTHAEGFGQAPAHRGAT